MILFKVLAWCAKRPAQKVIGRGVSLEAPHQKILMAKKNKEIYVVIWRDAAFSFWKKLPRELPAPKITTGMVWEETKDFVFVVTNGDYNEKRGLIDSTDGMIIPKKTILSIKKIKTIK